MSTHPGVTSRPSASISWRPLPVTSPTSPMQAPSTATSPTLASAPVPSTTVPFLMATSCMPRPYRPGVSGAIPRAGGTRYRTGDGDGSASAGLVGLHLADEAVDHVLQ